MIADIDTGAAVEYAWQKRGALLLGGSVAARTLVEAREELEAVYRQRPDLTPYILKLKLSLEQGTHWLDDQWLGAGERVVRHLGYGRCPYLVIRHTDTGRDHVHIEIAPITVDGHLVDRGHDHYRVQQILREIEQTEGLAHVPSSWEVLGRQYTRADIHRLRRGELPFREAMRKVVEPALRESTSWADLTERLDAQGVALERVRSGLVLTDGKARVALSHAIPDLSMQTLEQRYQQTYDDPTRPPPETANRPRPRQAEHTRGDVTVGDAGRPVPGPGEAGPSHGSIARGRSHRFPGSGGKRALPAGDPLPGSGSRPTDQRDRGATREDSKSRVGRDGAKVRQPSGSDLDAGSGVRGGDYPDGTRLRGVASADEQGARAPTVRRVDGTDVRRDDAEATGRIQLATTSGPDAARDPALGGVVGLLAEYRLQAERHEVLRELQRRIDRAEERLQRARSADARRDEASAALDRVLRQQTGVPGRVREWMDRARGTTPQQELLIIVEERHGPVVTQALRTLLRAEGDQLLPGERSEIESDLGESRAEMQRIRRALTPGLSYLRRQIADAWQSLQKPLRRQLEPEDRSLLNELGIMASRTRGTVVR